MELFKLFGSVMVSGTKETNAQLDKIDKKGSTVGEKLKKVGKGAAKFGTAVLGGATIASAAVVGLAKKTADTTDRIDKMSQKLGLSRKGFQEWEFILSQSGASMESMKMGMKTLGDRAVEASEGIGEGTKAFEALGVSVNNTDGSLKTQEELFEETVKALQGVEDKTKRAALANDLLGRSGQELAPVLNAGAGAVDNMKNKANELGLVLGDDAIDAGVKFTDTLDQMKRTLGAAAANIGASVLPMIQQFADFIMANMPIIQNVLKSVFSVLSTAVSSILPLFMNLIEKVLPPLIEIFTKIAEKILPPLIDLFVDIIEAILPPLMDLFIDIIDAILPPLIDLLKLITDKILPPLIKLFKTVIEAVLPPLVDLFKRIINALLPPLIELLGKIIDTVMPILIELFEEYAETVLPVLIDLLATIVESVLPPLIDIFMYLIDHVLPLLIIAFEKIMPVVETVMQTIASVITSVTSFISGDWEKVWTYITDVFVKVVDFIKGYVSGFADHFRNIFGGIKDVVVGIWDAIVSTIKYQINSVIRIINSFISGINRIKIPDWVPEIGGRGINISPIPLLAKGGDILRSGTAIVGEAGPELLQLPQGAKVSPLGAGAGITLNIHNPKFFSQRDMDKMLEGAVRRIKSKVATI